MSQDTPTKAAVTFPPGWSVQTDGKKFRWKNHQGITGFSYPTVEEVSESAWRVWRDVYSQETWRDYPL